MKMLPKLKAGHQEKLGAEADVTGFVCRGQSNCSKQYRNACCLAWTEMRSQAGGLWCMSCERPFSLQHPFT